MEIQKMDLFKIIDILKKEIDDNFSDSIEIDEQDYYWQISTDELYDPTKEPKQLTLGQISDDWSELLRLKDDQEEIPISYDLIRLSVILEVLKLKSSGKW